MDKPPQIPEQESQEEVSRKEGIDFVFEQTPELASIGTKEEYSEYLDTIFPESFMRGKIFQHQTKQNFDSFSDELVSAGRLGSGHYFSNFGNNYIDNKFHPITKVVSLDIKNPRIIEGGEYMKEVYSIMDERGINTDHIDERQKIENEHTNTLKKSYDALIGDKNGQLNSEILVFNSSQIHILGSQEDIEKFKVFMESKK